MTPLPLTIGPRTFVWGQRTYIMGIINCTPDSFAGDGVGDDAEAAVALAHRMEEEGADIIDVGGESTRPGSDPTQPGFQPVPPEEELRRVLPVIRRLAQELHIPISIDTYKAEVAREALRAGAHMVNDIWGFRQDPDIARMVAEAGVPAVVMHNQRGRPLRQALRAAESDTVRQGTPYHDVMDDILAGLAESIRIAQAARVPRERLIVDPGFGFGWTPQQNLEMLRRLGELRSLSRPILIGTSGKGTIGRVLGLPVEERLEGTAATVAIAIANGADIVRVHDVRAMVRVARMADAVVRGNWREEAQPATG